MKLHFCHDSAGGLPPGRLIEKAPSGRLLFQIIGAMAEFERSLIQERVRAGLRNAKLKGKTLGRPRRIVNGDQMARL